MHTFVKQLTFAPQKRKRYKCNQTGVVMTQKQILAYVSDVLAGGTGAAIGRSLEKASPPKKQTASSHSSKYRSKQRK